MFSSKKHREAIADLNRRVAKLEAKIKSPEARARKATPWVSTEKFSRGDWESDVIMLASRKKGMTVRELADRLEVDPAWARQRVLSAVDSGLIVQDGQRVSNGQRGKPPTVYRLP
ncbi:hypothetical protein UFOVP1313_30 [uncultured Caudovirales phage]|uniref:Uncharacterized protein n=1 Tax=uncultured Caudovirales phage TaxID=2100421 RepID=A0A6J5RNZ4_9CAUD|nr:hypothetical protein UFOVP1313_30 [uncultured Caudovirales phage]